MSVTNERHCGTALITGASSGIGREFANVLAEHRHDMVLLARRTARLDQLAGDLERRYGIHATPLTADLSVNRAEEQVYSELRDRGIAIDILINNAGFNVYGPFLETDLGNERRMLQVNLMAVVSLTKLFVRDMVGRGSGRVLNLGSTGSFAPAPFDSLYAASKAFVLSFSEALAEELHGTGVTITALCPGPTRTEFAVSACMTDTRIFGGKLLGPGTVASIGYEAMMRGKRIVIPGFGNRLQVWGMRLTPRLIVTRIAKGLMSRQAGVRPNARRAA